MLKVLLSLLIIFFLISGISFADFYQWDDENGNINMTDYPPPAESVNNIKIHKFAPPTDDALSSPADNRQKDSQTASAKNRYAKMEESNEVILYTTSWCPYCKMARDFFKSRNVSYAEYDIEKDPAAAERKKLLDDRSGVPFAIINGRPIHGYSPSEYERALK